MFEPAFKTLRALGFLPFSYSIFDKNFLFSNKPLFWTYFYNIIYLLVSTWRVNFVAENFIFYYTSNIYGLFYKYEALTNLIYTFVIIQPVFSKSGRKKLLKCMNLLNEIKLKKSSQMEKCIFYVAMTTLLVLSLCVEFIEIQCNSDIVGMNRFEYWFALWATWIQTISLMFCSIFYCVILDRTKMIANALKNISKTKKLKQLDNHYRKCVTLIHTFDSFEYFILRNVWLHCVYDIVFWYKGFQVYWNQYVTGETKGMHIAANVVGSFWTIYNVGFGFLLFFLGEKLQDEVIIV